MMIQLDPKSYTLMYQVLLWFFVQCLVGHSLSLHQENDIGINVLDVGKELVGEILPLNTGQRLYQLRGLKESTWYEVKISYPASIPASFSVQLRRDVPDIWFGKNRRLLNTEKLIFKANNDQRLMSLLLLRLLDLLPNHMLRRETRCYLTLFVMNYYLESRIKPGVLE